MENHECATCRYFEAYYTRAYCCYLRCNCGNCSHTGERVLKHFGCEKWTIKYHRIELKKSLVISEMSKVLAHIDTIREYIQNTDD